MISHFRLKNVNSLSHDTINCVIILFVTLLAYHKVFFLDYLIYDTPQYVYENFYVKQGITTENIKWAFTTTFFANYHPFTWLSHMLDVHFFGLQPGYHHGVNLLLHVTNSLILYFLLRKLTFNHFETFFITVLFALHPLHIESVAWIAERKDLLCMLFFLLTIRAYTWYLDHPVLTRYFLVILLFICGLMSKPMIVTLPAVLLLLDFWPLTRFSPSLATASHLSSNNKQRNDSITSILMEKIPLFLLSGIFSYLTFMAQKETNSVTGLDNLSVFERLANATVSYFLYIYHMFWPVKLAIFYPHQGMPYSWQIILAALVLVFSTTYVIMNVNGKPWLAMGWFWYMGTLVPVIGIVQVGAQAMADRYTYIPLTGLFIIISKFSSSHIRKNSMQLFMIISTMVILTGCTLHQLNYWKSGIALFTRAVEVTRNNYQSLYSIGLCLQYKDEYKQAIVPFKQALSIYPFFAAGHTALGVSYLKIGEDNLASKSFQEALRVAPNSTGARYYLGTIYAKQGQLKEAEKFFLGEIQVNNFNLLAYLALGKIKIEQGNHEQASIILKSLLARARRFNDKDILEEITALQKKHNLTL